MYDWGKEQEKEIATIKERTIYLNLSDADCKSVIRQIKRCLFRQIKTGLSEHLTME